MKRTLLSLSLLAGAVLGPDACASYDPPPRPVIVGAHEGIVDDASAPLVVTFGKSIDRNSLKLKVARFAVDSQGRLGDEDTDEATTLGVLFAHDPDDGDLFGKLEFLDHDTTIRITPSATLPIGPRLALLVEAGLEAAGGEPSTVRKRVLFGYPVKLTCDKPVSRVSTGEFFVLVEVDDPIKVQIRLFASLRVEPATGRFVGQFTRAMRNPNPNRCPTPCKSDEACRLLPAPACVVPSEHVGTVDEYSDLLPDSTSDASFSFTAEGCMEELGDSTTMGNSPVDVVVRSPAVTLRSTKLSAEIKADAAGVLRANGSLTAEQVQLGEIGSGGGSGLLTMRSIAPGSIAGIPAPPTSTKATP